MQVARRKSGRTTARTRTVLSMLLASSFILHPSSFARAEHPFITDDTGTQGKGNWQLELQGDFLRDKSTAGGVEQKSKGDTYTSVLSYGILDNLDVQVGLPFVSFRTSQNGVTVADESGVSDMTLELKWRFYEEGGLSLGLKPGLTLPTGDENKEIGRASCRERV